MDRDERLARAGWGSAGVGGSAAGGRGVQDHGAHRAMIYPRSTWPRRTDIFDLGGLRLTFRRGAPADLGVRLGGFDFGGERYAVEPPLVDARLDISRMTGEGYALRLRFDAGAHRAVHALPRARRAGTSVDAREVDQPGGGEELTSPYVDDGDLDLGRLGARRLRARAPVQACARSDCAGLCPECGANLNTAGPEHHHEPGARPALGEAARAAPRLTAMTGAETESVLRRTYDAFNARDVEAVLVGHAPRRRLAERVGGRPGPRARRGARLLDAPVAEIDPRVDADRLRYAARRYGSRSTSTRWSASPAGDLLSEGDVVHVYAFRDGLVERMDVEPGGG